MILKWLDKFAKVIKDNILEITTVGYLFLFVCWVIGYFCNALLGTKFELSSAWQGLGTLMGAGVFSSVKYLADSGLNSERGTRPYLPTVERRNTVNDERRISERDCERSDSDRS